MKKFILTSALLGLLALFTWYAYNFQGFFIDLDPGALITAHSTAWGKELAVRDEDGKWQPFEVRGVVLNGSLPGYVPNAFQPDEGTYLRWMRQIGDLGANTIRVYTVMDEEFYNALYTYNAGNNTPLYLLQSVRISDSMTNSARDAYESGFAEALLADGKEAVDVIHGKRIILANKTRGSGTYRKDISKWVLGFIIGHEWNPATIAYTNNRSHSIVYDGEFIRAKEGATVFEAMLASVMDQVVGYESRKYKVQRLISFMNDPSHDPFVYDQLYGRQIPKFSQLDIEQIEGTAMFHAGLFAAYRAYTFLPDFWSYLSREQIIRLGDIPARVDRRRSFDGYVQLLSEYHTAPVVVASLSFSSSRGIDTLHYGGPIDEKRQGELLVKAYEDIMATGASGAIITGYKDNWGQRAWNTSYAVDLSRAHMWHDLQTVAQSDGLLALEPIAYAPRVTIDGNPLEWEETKALVTQDGMKLYATYDAEALYVCVAGGVSSDVPLYVVLDVTPKSGSATYPPARLAFDRDVDFVLRLQGTGEGSRLLVQARYESRRANFFFETMRQDAYINPPQRDSNVFVPILSVLRRLGIPPETPEGQEPPPQYGTYETGRLTDGNADSLGTDFNSLTDVSFGLDAVEARIPWSLLNFSDPSAMMIHDDYYEHYGVKFIRIDALHIGLAQEGRVVGLEPLLLAGWEEVQIRERKKQSYYIVQKAWGVE